MSPSVLITVTGATGTIGSGLVARLARAGKPTRALSRDPSGAPAADRIAWVRADLGDAEVLPAALAGTTRLFLLSGNVEGFPRLQINALRAAREVGVGHIVKLSALGASDHSRSPIGRDHWEVEQAIEDSGVPYTHLRPHAFMQNWLDDVADSVRREATIHQAIDDGRVPFVDTRDVAEVAFRILLEPQPHAGRKYVLTGPEAVSYGDVADRLSELLGTRVTYSPQTLEQARERMERRGMSPYMVESNLALARYQRQGGPTAQVSEDVRELLGRPSRSIEDFLADHAERFRSEPAG